jgi:hypothetical protein
MTKPIPKFIGASVRRREDPALIRGEGRYTADIPLPGAASMAFVRSPYAHARVKAIDASAALSVRGVLTVFTLDDLLPLLKLPLPVIAEADGGTFEEVFLTERYPLASDRVRHVGDPVAVVLAEDPYAAADGVAAVSVEYEPLPPLATPEGALWNDAPSLHTSPRATGPSCGRSRAATWKELSRAPKESWSSTPPFRDSFRTRWSLGRWPDASTGIPGSRSGRRRRSRTFFATISPRSSEWTRSRFGSSPPRWEGVSERRATSTVKKFWPSRSRGT